MLCCSAKLSDTKFWDGHAERILDECEELAQLGLIFLSGAKGTDEKFTIITRCSLLLYNAMCGVVWCSNN